MEKVGLSFRVPNQYGKLLVILFKNLLESSSSSTWVKGDHVEILFHDVLDLGMQHLEKLTILSNKQLKEYVSFSDHYPIMATFSGYSSDEEIVKAVKTGREFLITECQTLISIVDSTEILFLSKNVYLIDNMEEQCQQNRFSDVKHITKEKCLGFVFD
ncbi:DUF2691 family protein [Ornithinibacillus contaminans]|uniref:DUF2691 family protein n=1 Tax=Ornithinibacillus contaminans TaxID=694055 RepID=UPI00064DDB29|nr:DUF2691 family protein [Ornithinibacillus contaminans]